MSCWTHITSCISVDTYKVDKNIVRTVKNVIKNAPKITGSEEDAEVFVNKKRGYNTYYDNKAYQTCVVISIQGDLRDRTPLQTNEEFLEFLNYIRKYYEVRDYSINIEI